MPFRSRLFFFGIVLAFCFIWLEAAVAQTPVEVRIVAGISSSPVSGAAITFRNAHGKAAYEGRSAPDGMLRFPAMEPGEYQLEIEAPGYFPVKQQVLVKPRQPINVVAELTSRDAKVERVVVRASSPELDPSQTGSAHTLTAHNLENIPSPLRRDIPTLAENFAPGAIQSHDNFIHLRGNELSLHQFINGVSFLDNAHAHFTAGLSPQIFESVNIITGGFPAEFGNRFGGILDVTTRSGRSLDGHGSASFSLGSVGQNDASLEYGGSSGRWGFYGFASGFESDRFLNPPIPNELHDFGNGLRAAAQIDFQGAKNSWKLLLLGGGSNFELPNTVADEAAGRDASRRVRSETAILSWQRVQTQRLLLTASAYLRDVSDRLLATTDPVTPFGEASRSTLTVGLKSDVTYARGRHTWKTGIDSTLLRLRESFRFDPRDPADPLGPFYFPGRDLGSQVSFYVQDHFNLFRNFTVDAGLRWDQVNLVGSYHQVSPRIGFAYYVPRTHSVFHFTYNRLFAPPPLEYPVLASFLGANSPDPVLRVGNIRPYRQNYFEAGWSQQLHPKLILEWNAYLHRGKDSFENSEVSNTRLFLPTNFDHARASGMELSLNLKQLERIGLSGRIQYSLAQVQFFGPFAGGFADEVLAAGERIFPAFDQRHTGTAGIYYRSSWESFWTGFQFHYGSGT
ncbi:MAG: TonB-dependent receptor, partial [Acidobacteria bacterium]|nr:TonB-dependent receptor [Acidobacteriota bacterium]